MKFYPFYYESVYRYSKSDPSAVQPLASRYTDCAIPAQILTLEIENIFLCNESTELLKFFKDTIGYVLFMLLVLSVTTKCSKKLILTFLKYFFLRLI
jgi:hypothetical protein